MEMKFNRHADGFKCESTIEFCVKNPWMPEGVSNDQLEFEYETGEFTNDYAKRCFDAIMKSGYDWISGWSFAGRSNGWFVLLCDIDAVEEHVRKRTIYRIKRIVENYFRDYGKEFAKHYGIIECDELPTAEDLENQGNMLDSYPVDESITVPNAGDAMLYELNGRKYQLTVWNERADEHECGSKEVREIKDTEY